MRRAVFFLGILLLSVGALSAQQRVEVYYDSTKILKEVFTVDDADPKVLSGLYEAYYLDGSPRVQGNYNKGKPFGQWTYFYEDGEVKMRARLKDEKTGDWQHYFENGKLEKEGTIKDGERAGPWVFYFQSGAVSSKGEYERGLQQGLWRYYYEDGALKAVGNYIDGFGDYDEFYADGSLKMHGVVTKPGEAGLWEYYSRTGKLEAKGPELDGLREGPWKLYHPNGRVAAEGKYKAGKPEGPWVYYHPDGSESAKGTLSEGLREGEWKLSYRGGIPRGGGDFKDGTGDYVEYYPSGKLRVKGRFEEGKHEGLWKYYYDDGTIEGICDYKNGVGEYTGFYPDSTIKMRGILDGADKIGKWELHKPSGELQGYYHILNERSDRPIYDQLVEVTPRDTLGASDSSNVVIPNLILNQRKVSKIRNFNPRRNEFRSLIVSANPASMIVGSLPISIEYYMQERLGYAFYFSILSNPFLTSNDQVDLRAVYRRGFAVDWQQRFYDYSQQYSSRFYGMFSLAHEVRFLRQQHRSNVLNNTVMPAEREVYSIDERAFEYVITAGSRFMRHPGKPSWTFDAHVGLGIGYRDAKRNYPRTISNDAIFSRVPGSGIYLPLRLRLMLGYMF